MYLKTDDAGTYCAYAKQSWYMSKNCGMACVCQFTPTVVHVPKKQNEGTCCTEFHKNKYNMYHNLGHAKNYNPWAMGLVP